MPEITDIYYYILIHCDFLVVLDPQPRVSTHENEQLI